MTLTRKQRNQKRLDAQNKECRIKKLKKDIANSSRSRTVAPKMSKGQVEQKKKLVIPRTDYGNGVKTSDRIIHAAQKRGMNDPMTLQNEPPHIQELIKLKASMVRVTANKSGLQYDPSNTESATKQQTADGYWKR